MDFFIFFLFFMLGIGVGTGGTAFLLRNRDKQETEQTKNGYEAEVETLNGQLRDLKTKMESVRDEGKRYWDDLQKEKKLRVSAEEKSKVIPGLESQLEAKKGEVTTLSQENNELKTTVANLEKELSDERQSFQESLIFVQGSHYLPAEVVRRMMRQQDASSQPDD